MNKELFKKATLIRCFEEKLLELFSQGKLSGTVHTCIGQEFCALAVIENLSKGDWIFSNHRCHGHYLAWTNDVRGLLAEIMGKTSGICAGRGGSQHIYSSQFLSNGVQGGGVPIAAGCAYGLKSNPDSQSIAVAFIGDGTLGQGVLYETLNFASKWEIPLLIVLEHNGYAQSTDTKTTIAGAIRPRFEAFNFKHWESSIWRGESLFTVASEAVQYVRDSRCPAILQIDCYRLKAHSKGDDNRDAKEVASYEERDPLNSFFRDEPKLASEIRGDCEAVIQKALEAIENESVPTPQLGQKNEEMRRSEWRPLPAPEKTTTHCGKAKERFG